MIRNIVGFGVLGLWVVLAEASFAQNNAQNGPQGRPRHMMQGNGQNNLVMANQANGQNNQMADQDMSNLAQVLLTNYDADGSGALDATELSQALLGLRELMMRNQRGMQNANNNANANNANANQAARGMDMRRDMGGGGRGMRARGGGPN